MVLSEIKKIAEEREKALSKIAVQIGMSPNNLHKCIRDNRMEAGQLEKIAEILDVSVLVFFDEGINLIASEVRKKKKSAHCTGCIDKSEIISLQRDKISLLERNLNDLENELAAAKKEVTQLPKKTTIKAAI